MRFAIDLPVFGDVGDPRLLVELAQAAERTGWDGFFVWDHLVPPTPMPTTDPWVALSAIAVSTSHIRLGPMVTPLPRRRPAKVAREAVALDRLSRGRLVLGVGIGSADDAEFEAFGDAADRRDRGAILDESLDVIGRLWSGEPVDYQGRHVKARAERFLPTPLQQPRIPIWVAGHWPNKPPMRRAARWDGAFPIGTDDLSVMLSPEGIAEAIGYVRQNRSASGPFDLVHAGLLSGERDHDLRLVRRYAEVGVTWWLEHIYPGRLTLDQIRDLIEAGPPREPRAREPADDR